MLKLIWPPTPVLLTPLFRHRLSKQEEVKGNGDIRILLDLLKSSPAIFKSTSYTKGYLVALVLWLVFSQFHMVLKIYTSNVF